MSDVTKQPPTLLGMRVVTSPYLPPPGTERGYSDWRERLARNLTVYRAGQWRAWEPLTFAPPNVFMLGNQIFAHPRTIATLTNIAND